MEADLKDRQRSAEAPADADSQKRYENLQRQLAQREHEVADSTQRLPAYEEQLTNLEQLRALSERLYSEEVNANAGKILHFHNYISRLQKELGLKRDRVVELEKTVRQCEEPLRAKVKAEQLDHQTRIAELNDSIAVLNSEIVIASVDEEKATVACSQALRDLGNYERLRAKLNLVEQTQQAAIAGEIEAKGALRIAEKQLVDAQQHANFFEQQLGEVKREKDQVELDNEELLQNGGKDRTGANMGNAVDKKKFYNRLKSAKTTASRALEQLTTAKAEVASKTSRVVKLEVELRKSENTIEDLKTTCARLRNDLADESDLVQAKRDLQRKLRHLVQQHALLLEISQRSNSTNAGLEVENRQLVRQNQQLRDENSKALAHYHERCNEDIERNYDRYTVEREVETAWARATWAGRVYTILVYFVALVLGKPI